MDNMDWIDSFMKLLFVFGGGVSIGVFIVSQYIQNELEGNESDNEVITEDYFYQ